MTPTITSSPEMMGVEVLDDSLSDATALHCRMRKNCPNSKFVNAQKMPNFQVCVPYKQFSS